jgi:hypothetical protein
MPYASGNALGYVRMVRSASMYYCSEAVKYLPDFDDIINFEDCAGLGMRSEQDADGGGRAVVCRCCWGVRCLSERPQASVCTSRGQSARKCLRKLTLTHCLQCCGGLVRIAELE